jgi:hypothetical protein
MAFKLLQICLLTYVEPLAHIWHPLGEVLAFFRRFFRLPECHLLLG